MKVLNNIIRHIENNYEEKREYSLDSYTKSEVECVPAWQHYVNDVKRNGRF